MRPHVLLLLSFLLTPVTAAAQNPEEQYLEDIQELSSEDASQPGQATAAGQENQMLPATAEALSEIGPPIQPFFHALQSNPNNFGVFADGGWDGNWYIGFDACWIVRLPPVPKSDYVNAYVGAKLGRSKTRPHPSKRGQKEIIPGKIYMAISSTPAFTTSQSFFLADTKDIPQEADTQLPVLGAGHAEWFWAEVPMKLVNFNGPNFLAIWSPTENFLSVSSAPILAAAVGGTGSQAWINRAIHGSAPRHAETSLETPITYFQPALAMKLTPRNTGLVYIRGFAVDPQKDFVRASFSALGEDLSMAWLEAVPTADGERPEWKRISPYLRHPPYIFDVPNDALPNAHFSFRGAAQDILGNTGYSQPLMFNVTEEQPDEDEK
ncbi:MAG: hypothetical protein A3G41_06695 [Elusimicrobia bacterium RIFCSPLOWO2_12_FULL_59_9]|nr:MAG: hypothetical protein A3G41_06695 [Elusimicrobia bacterium RIFCSPLOWO2_12_FULL_59_9]